MKTCRLTAPVISGLVVVLAWWLQPAPPEAADGRWTLTRLAAEMADLGYQCELVDNDRYPQACVQGLFLARRDDARTWDEIVSGRVRLQPSVKWRGLVGVSRDFCGTTDEGRPEQLNVGPFFFYGDPEEIARIAAHFREQRR